MLRVEDDLATLTDAECDRLLDHREVFVVRRLEHARHLPCVALADQGPDRRPALGQRLQIYVVLASTARAPGRSERGQPGVAERLLGEVGEQLLIFWVRAGKAALHVVESQPVEEARDALLVGGRKRDSRTLSAVAQGGVVDHDSSGGHKKTSRPFLGGRSNRHQRRALSRGTSPANLDGDAALSAHAGGKARASG